ncbi:MAG: rod shape-determining protein RodA, partial [Eudoraea sp.]|nr:rod shape-determining protein RodA [Eudoraea sp.]
MSGRTWLGRVDWLSIFLFLILTALGWVSIYSSTFSEEHTSIFDFSQLYGKQLFFIGLSLVVAIAIMLVESNFYERFGSIFYIGTMVLLLGLFVFGKTIAGATSWYDLGFFNLQPSELAKFATALALAKYM